MKADINVSLFKAFLAANPILSQESVLMDESNTIEVCISGFPLCGDERASSFDLTYCVIARDLITYNTTQKFYIGLSALLLFTLTGRCPDIGDSWWIAKA